MKKICHSYLVGTLIFKLKLKAFLYTTLLKKQLTDFIKAG